MNGNKLFKLVQQYRQARDDAYGEGDDYPAIEAAFSIEAKKQIRKRFGDVVANLVDGLQDKVDAANEALSDLEDDLELIETIAGLIQSAEKAEQLVDEVQNSEAEAAPVGAGEENDGSHKIKTE